VVAVTGIPVQVDGTCARCRREALGLQVLPEGGVCKLCLGQEVGPRPSLDRCPACGMSYACDLCGATPAPAGAKRWVVLIDQQPPSQNDFKAGLFPPQGASAGQLRRMMMGQAGKYAGLVRDWRKALDARLRAADVWRATTKRRVVFIRLLAPRNRFLDQFNFIGGLKPVVDALVHLEALLDDDAKSFEGHARQRRCDPGEAPGLRLEITEL